MILFALAVLFSLLAFKSNGATASMSIMLTITNAPDVGDAIGFSTTDLRTAVTNDIVATNDALVRLAARPPNPSSQFVAGTNDLITATNLYYALSSYRRPPMLESISMTETNVISFTTLRGYSYAITNSGTWVTISITTNSLDITLNVTPDITTDGSGIRRLMVETEGISASVTGATNQNISSVGGTAVTAEAGIPVAIISGGTGGGEVTSDSITNLLLQIIATNSAALNAVSNEVYLLKEQIADGIGITNALSGMTNEAGEYLEVAPRASTNAITFDAGVTLPAFAATPTVAPTASTNQVSFSMSQYSLGNNITDAGVVTNAAWATTNGFFHAAGGSCFVTDMIIISSTNRDYVIWIFPKIVSAPTIGSAWVPTRSVLQGMKGPYATTNTLYCSEWQIMSTNFVKRINLGFSMHNTDSTTNGMIVATYLDTKADVAANAVQVEVGSISDK